MRNKSGKTSNYMCQRINNKKNNVSILNLCASSSKFYLQGEPKVSFHLLFFFFKYIEI